MQVNPITQLYNDFITILDKSVIKYKNEAEKFETVETKKSADGYIMAYIRKLMKIYVIAALTICNDADNLCKINGFRRIDSDSYQV